MNKKECWKLIFSALAVFGFCFGSIAKADSPARDSLSDVNYSNYRSSQVNGSYTTTLNVQLSTGVIRLDSVIISSAGVNSQLFLYDSNVSSGGIGNSTFVITGRNNNGEQTNSVREIPFRIETSTQGLTFTSTCTAANQVWAPPVLRFIYERKR